MLYFYWEIIDSKLNKFQGILQTIMSAPLFSTIFSVSVTKNYIIADIVWYILHYSGLLLPQIIIGQ